MILKLLNEIRIIWPSGIIHKLYSINVNQHLNIVEIKNKTWGSGGIGRRA